MRVYLRRGQVRVAQQFLHVAQVGAVIEQVGCKAVSQGVRGNLAVDGGLLDVGIDLAAYAAVGQCPAPLVDEYIGYPRLYCSAAGSWRSLADREPGLDGGDCGWEQGKDALLPAFAERA